MTTAEMRALVAQITYKTGWTFAVLEEGVTDQYLVRFLRVEVEGTCNDTGEPLRWHGRKWHLSTHATESEILQTALKAVLTAEEHEAREHFRWRGVEIFCPHLNLDELRVAIIADHVGESVRPAHVVTT